MPAPTQDNTPATPAPPRRRPSWHHLVKELSGFLVVGGTSFVLDAGLFQLLYAHAGVESVLAKTASSLVSMTVAYLGHRYWSFSHRGRTAPAREYVVFLVVNGLTLALTVAMVAFVRYPLGQQDAAVLQATNLASIVLGTIIRFLAYRRWVFPAQAAPAALPTAAASSPAGPDRLAA